MAKDVAAKSGLGEVYMGQPGKGIGRRSNFDKDL